jgi:hypothetical protein
MNRLRALLLALAKLLDRKNEIVWIRKRQTDTRRGLIVLGVAHGYSQSLE